MPTSTGAQRLAELLAPVVAGQGLDLEGVTLLDHRTSAHLRIVVDKDGGVQLDEIAAASQAISHFLDNDAEADAIIGPRSYTLEVSSPGIDRPLVEPRHWRRAIGRLVRVQLPDLGPVVARVQDVTGDQVRLGIEWQYTDDGACVRQYEERTVPIADVRPGQIEVEFEEHP
ncbi:MAG: ribosome maturation factor RimP [Acidothermus cellulolyticus]|nr:ribosome maturation factor RimP [Acidothermus cellulolyticus]